MRLFQAFDVCFARIYHRLHVYQHHRLPRKGAAIVVCNHTSGLDPLLIQSVCPRLIHWMMAKEFYDLKALNWIFRAIQAIPVARSGRDVSATRMALRVLSDGGVLGVFPEGRIENARQLMTFQTGVAMMSIKTGVPIYPAYLDGTQRNKEMLQAFMFPNRSCIAFGAPIHLPPRDTSREALEAATAKIQEAVEDLQRQTPPCGAAEAKNITVQPKISPISQAD